MSNASNLTCPAATAPRHRASVATQWLSGLILTALLVALCPARAQGPDDQYLRIYNLIQQADELNSSGKTTPAQAKYYEAHTALKKFQQDHPGWNSKLVAYRLNYVAQKLVALSEKPPAAAAAVAPAATTNVPAAPPTAKPAAPTSGQPVKLLAAGAEPRKVLRLRPKPGDKQTLSLTMKMAIETKAGEVPAPAMKLPAMTLTFDTTVQKVAGNGDITYQMVMGDIRVSSEPEGSPEVAEAITKASAGIKGHTSSGLTSDRGFAKELEFKTPPAGSPQAGQLVDQMKDLYSQLAAPLPEEAVGVGARWEVKTPIKAQGMTMEQTSTYELTALEGDRFTTKSTVAQRAANQTIQHPALAGMKMNVTKMTGKGTGQSTFNLNKLLPTVGTGNVLSEVSMTMNMGGQKQAMTMKTDINLKFESK